MVLAVAASRLAVGKKRNTQLMHQAKRARLSCCIHTTSPRILLVPVMVRAAGACLKDLCLSLTVPRNNVYSTCLWLTTL